MVNNINASTQPKMSTLLPNSSINTCYNAFTSLPDLSSYECNKNDGITQTQTLVVYKPFFFLHKIK